VLNVLLVEDNPINQDLARRRLKKLGHQVTLAENGHEAVKSVWNARFDCILMDIQMPDMDGFEATEQIRAYEAEAKLAPQYIVAMTAHAMKGDRERCLNSGMDDYIPKPFRAERLKEVLMHAALAALETAELKDEAAAERSNFAKRLKAMDADDREDVLAAAPIFLKAFPKDVLKLQNAVSQKDIKECYFVAHTMKGVAGIFGSERCMDLAEQLEAACTEGDEASLQTRANDLIEGMRALAKDVEFAAI